MNGFRVGTWNHPGARVAIVGGGVSGLVAARALCEDYEVDVFDASCHAGGHAHTIDVELDGIYFPCDVGFMVFNERTYPNFCRLLSRLGVASRESDMSFGVACERSGLEYCGSSLAGLFAQPSSLVYPRFWKMLYDVLRFNREALTLLDRHDESLTLRQFVGECGFSEEFLNWYLVPMGAAIWSARWCDFLEFPACFIVGFFHNHGLLQISHHPQWRTIVGGSRTYVAALTAPFRERIHCGTPVKTIHRKSDHVEVLTAGGETQRFDAVILATHPDIALRLLADACPREQEILSAFVYQPNEGILHTDEAILPEATLARASWNYRVPRDDNDSVLVTYDLRRLQGHAAPRPILLTLNGLPRIDPAKVVETIPFRHPVYSSRTWRAQRRREEIQGERRTYFCGAYWANGFHEDGVTSGLAVARHFGKEL